MSRQIKRNSYLSEKELVFYTNIGKDFVENNLGQTVYYYKVNREASDVDTLYGETSGEELILENPIQIQGVIDFEEATQKSYNENNTLQYMESGNMIAGFYIEHLKECDVEFCLGDFIAYRFSEELTKFYQISQDGRSIENNKYMFGGRRPYYIEIIATPVDNDKLQTM